LIEAEEGDELEVFVENELSVDNTIHWHGEYSLLSWGVSNKKND
jgi:FtsP/CotA-like multicopper oxidase with cupredoxin domain